MGYFGGGGGIGSDLAENNLLVGNAAGLAIAKKLRLPEYSDLFVAFEPSFSVEAVGGDFPGAAVVEKGYTVPEAVLAWASQAGGDFPIDDSGDYELDGAPIALAGLDPLTGGNYQTPFNESDHGAGFSVRLDSGEESVVKTALFYWRWRMFWFADAAASLTPGEFGDIFDKSVAVDNDALRTGRTGTFNFDASGGKYLWFLWPKSFGEASQFVFAGLPTTFNKIDPGFVIPNQYGASTECWAYRSQEIQTGSDLDIIVS